MLNWDINASITNEVLNETATARIQIQYEAENLLEEYENFKNPNLEYREDAIMGEAHKEEKMDETEKALKHIEFEMKAQQLFFQLRAHQLDKPNLDRKEDRLIKEYMFIDFCWTKFHDLVTLSVPYFYEIENIAKWVFPM